MSPQKEPQSQKTCCNSQPLEWSAQPWLSNLDFPTGLLCPDFWCGWVTPTTVQHLLLGLAQWAIDWDLALRPVKQMLYCLSSRVWSVARVRTWVQLALQIVTHPQLYGDASHRLQVLSFGVISSSIYHHLSAQMWSNFQWQYPCLGSTQIRSLPCPEKDGNV